MQVEWNIAYLVETGELEQMNETRSAEHGPIEQKLQNKSIGYNLEQRGTG